MKIKQKILVKRHWVISKSSAPDDECEAWVFRDRSFRKPELSAPGAQTKIYIPTMEQIGDDKLQSIHQLRIQNLL